MAKEAEISKLPKEGVEAVVLLASLLPINDSGCAPQRYVETNTIGALNVLEYCRINKIKKIIYGTSHFDVAKLWDSGRAITEEDDQRIIYTDDHTVYIISKVAAVNLVEHYHQAHGVVGISFRLPGVYGFGPHTERYAGGGKVRVLRTTVFIQKAIAGEPIDIWGDPSRGHDFVYVKDIVGAIIGALDSNRSHGLYNIASGVRTLWTKRSRVSLMFSHPPHAVLRFGIGLTSPIYQTHISMTSVKQNEILIIKGVTPLWKCFETSNLKWRADVFHILLIVRKKAKTENTRGYFWGLFYIRIELNSL